ncbi:MAG: hypothetical protein JNM58_14935 [Xanthomonadaceae bacterium]|nr:hypothetical protein [Xanthomonadaceae bacterium]
MNRVEQIKSQLQKFLLDDEHRAYCIAIFDCLLNADIQELRVMTYGSIASRLCVPWQSPKLLLAVNFFASSRDFHFLDQKYFVVCDENDYEVEIDIEMVREALSSGLLELPNGEVTDQVDAHLVPYFTASKCLKIIRDSR